MQMYVADFSYFYPSKYTLKWTVSHFNVIQYFRIDEKTFKNSNFVHENMKKWSKKHPQNTLKSTAPIWVLGVPTLYIHISELNTCELCFVMYQGSRLFPHWFCTVYYYIDGYVELVLHWVWCFCSMLLLLADLTRTLSTIVTHFSNCSLYYVASFFFVAS